MNEKKKRLFAELRIRRTARGTCLYIRSRLLEDFFASKPGRGGGNYNGWEYYPYPFDSIPLPDGGEAALNKAQVADLLLDREARAINLSFFRIKGVSKGVRVNLPMVYSRESLESFLRRAEDALRWLYQQYFRPLSKGVLIIEVYNECDKKSGN